MPTYSCHFSDPEASAVDTAIAASSEKTEGRYIKEAIRQRMEREGYLPDSDNDRIRKEALSTAEVVGTAETIQVLQKKRVEALAEKAAKVA